jgi:uncharacterized membrane protein YobD (UPF0266 family)
MTNIFKDWGLFLKKIWVKYTKLLAQYAKLSGSNILNILKNIDTLTGIKYDKSDDTISKILKGDHT